MAALKRALITPTLQRIAVIVEKRGRRTDTGKYVSGEFGNLGNRLLLQSFDESSSTKSSAIGISTSASNPAR